MYGNLLYTYGMVSDTTTTRLDLRVSQQNKQIVQEAAALKGISVTDFVVQAAKLEAERTLAEHHIIRLVQEDARAFYDALQNPPEPNEALQEAARAFRAEAQNL